MSLQALSLAIKPFIPVAVNLGQQGIQRLVPLVKAHFNSLQWSFVSLYGAKEILFDRVKDIRDIKNPDRVKHAHRVNVQLNKIFLKKDVFIKPIRFSILHGTLYVASGLVGTVAALQKQGVLNIAAQLQFPLEVVGNGLFGLASLVALIQNIRTYRAAAKIPPHAPFYERQAANQLKKSAILGILSSLNYIIGAALILIGPLSSLALLFGCVAVFFGCLKILYDYLRFRNAV